ncbi:hypothetical protein LMG28614_07083 [Paraburkholderia ultramafica]|uniref:Transposase IS116/IS110/IS902 C-terminal domain-containing protein n=1 Tax=Paraburkholderia ultramafica TaxID=1544867 RepID=A0A6S7D7L4_9BURK|nr:hypothetical protein LMG28614_07083 [Paraburkholderia ultramafica]
MNASPRQWMQEDKAVKAIAEMLGVGVLTATAVVATTGDAKSCRSGREFAAWLGLVPKQLGSCGKITLLGISKRGDPLPAHVADSWCTQRIKSRERAWPVGRADQQASATERSHRGARQQDGEENLGNPGLRQTVPERLRQRETGMND